MTAGPALRLDVTADGLRVYATVCTAGAGAVPPSELAAELVRRGVCVGVALETVGRLAGGAAQLPSGTRVLVAEGHPAIDGAHGRLELLVDVSDRPQYAAKADGSLDFREPNLVHVVREGQRLAVVHAPTAGRAGRSVFGQALTARAGHPARLRLGPNVAAVNDGRELVARAAGRLVFDGVRISVAPALVIPGDVDYSVGNIRFPGFVTVRGNVPDGFEVQGDRGIEVGGTAGACVLRSSGDVAVHGGINGHGKALIEAGGRVRAKYLNEAVVRAHGDVEVATEVVNSRVYCLGRLLVPNGAVIGGEAMASGGVAAQTLGSELGVQTRVTIGKDYDVVSRQEAAAARAAAIDAGLPALVKRLEAMADRKKFLALPEPERERVKGEYDRFKALKAERLAIEEQLKGLAAQAHAPAEAPEVRVSGLLYQDVSVAGQAGSYTNTEVFRGPLALVEDRTAGRVVLRH